MSPLEIRQWVASGAVRSLSQDQAVALRDQVLANHRDELTNPRNVNFRIYSDAVVELSKAAFGEGADLPMGSDGTVRTGNEP